MAGTYLAKSLEGYGIAHTIYDTRKTPDCRCAWGIMYRQAKDLMSAIGYNIDDYIINKPEELVFNDITLKNKNVYIFSKAAYLEDLWKELNPRKPHNPEDLDGIKVDATGNRRAIIGKDGVVAECIQHKVRGIDLDNNIYIYTDRPTGYAWAFPLGDDEWHIGAGGITNRDTHELLSMFKEKYGIKNPSILCNCTGTVGVMHTPFTDLKLYDAEKKVFAVGEAAGFVNVDGEGNTPAMESAELLGYAIAHSSDFDTVREIYIEGAYERFKWLQRQYELLDAVVNRDYWGITKLIPSVAVETIKRVGFNISTLVKIVSSILRQGC
ncbi:MAG: NAD(P)/FAD-dependent oxidoreductase [Methermicoccaceae archaeon]